jgi:hypothetical protein
VKRRAFLQLMLTAAALASTRPLRAAAAAVLPEPETPRALLPPMPRHASSTGQRLIAGYGGPLCRVRTNDGREVDVYAGKDGNAVWPANIADRAPVVTYDQSGNGNHIGSVGHSGPMHRWNPRSEPEQEIGYVVCGQSNMTEGPLEPGGPNRHERRKQARLQR